MRRGEACGCVLLLARNIAGEEEDLQVHIINSRGETCGETRRGKTYGGKGREDSTREDEESADCGV